MLSICLLVSGGLGLRVLGQVYESPHRLAGVFTDKKSTEIIAFCKAHQIPVFAGNPRKGKAATFIQGISCEILLSVNYLFLIEKDLIDLPTRYAINIHGSLLPKYRGRTPHVWAIINGEKETGVTAHLMDEEVDNGKIVQQVVVPIEAEDTGGKVLEKFWKIYPQLVERILADIEADRIEPKTQEISEAVYFGKRTPADGQINWDWSKARIRNWVRAQAKPYPGAFTFYEGKKLIVHRVDFSNLGYHYEQANGTILAIGEGTLIVKTPNGALQLSQLETAEALSFRKEIVLA